MEATIWGEGGRKRREVRMEKMEKDMGELIGDVEAHGGKEELQGFRMEA